MNQTVRVHVAYVIGPIARPMFGFDFVERPVYDLPGVVSPPEATLRQPFPRDVRVPVRPHFGVMGVAPAEPGRLSSIPNQVMNTEVETPNIWECTRLVMSDEVTGHHDRAQCLQLIVDGLVSVANRHGGDELMSLSPLPLMRTLRQLGFAAERIGEPYFNPGDGRKYAVLAMKAQHSHAFLSEFEPVLAAPDMPPVARYVPDLHLQH